jgi:uncharacterized SAM-binding protein YcdF (DUF218 family)
MQNDKADGIPIDRVRIRFWTALLLLTLAFAGVRLLLSSGRLLVLDQPVRSDVILVLDGDNDDVRFWRAVNLLRAGYARDVLLDQRSDHIQFGQSQANAAQQFVARLQLDHVLVCPGRMQSTAEEVEFAGRCLAMFASHRILIVTSPYHTRRALTIFRHRLPQYQWSVAAAEDRPNYGVQWWRSRAWAKTWLSETQKFAWWELVDRWRYGPIATS